MKNNGSVRIMSRSAFEITFPTAGKGKEKSKPSSFFKDLKYVRDDAADKPWYVAEEDRPTQAERPMSFEETKVKLHMEMSKTKTAYGTCFYASECVVAATWNVDRLTVWGA